MVLLHLALIAVAALVLIRGLARFRRPEPRPRDAGLGDDALIAKLESIAQGERDGVESLARIASSRVTPDRPRARALRMLVERGDEPLVREVLAIAARGCGRETCAALFALAARFPDRAQLEGAALAVLSASADYELRLAAIGALTIVGAAAALPGLERIERTHTPDEMALAVVNARRAIEARLAPPGALSSPPSDSAQLSLVDRGS